MHHMKPDVGDGEFLLIYIFVNCYYYIGVCVILTHDIYMYFRYMRRSLFITFYLVFQKIAITTTHHSDMSKTVLKQCIEITD